MSKQIKWRKKPIVIYAIQFDGTVECGHAIVDWIWREMGRGIGARFGLKGLEIKTLETSADGWFEVSPNDFVIHGIKGEFYACKPDIFHSTYEAVES